MKRKSQGRKTAQRLERPRGLGFYRRVPLGAKIDRAVDREENNKAIALMRKSEQILTLRRRRIGEGLRNAETEKERARYERWMRRVNKRLGKLCYHLRG